MIKREAIDVVVTGIGMVTPLGNDAASTWEAAAAGRCGIERIDLFDPSGFPTQIGAQVRDFEVPDEAAPGKYRKYLDRKLGFAMAAAHEALGDAGLLGADLVPERFGVSIGTEAGRPRLGDVAQRYLEAAAGDTTSLEQVDPVALVQINPNLCGWLLSALYQARGPNKTISTACTSAAQAIGDALDQIRWGQADVMIAGGCDALVEAFMVTGFSLLGALSKRNDEPSKASRPFDARRDGFVLGEGAGFLILESAEHARARGARVRARLAGYGSSANAYRITDSPPDGSGAVEAMQAAVADAHLKPEDVEYVNAHGTSTAMNDVSETNALKRLFGERASQVPVSSTKSMMGHLVAACGAVEAGVTLMAMEHGLLPPTINQELPDPECDLDYVPNEARPATVRVAMSNSFGFGGNNATLVFEASP